MLTPRQFLLRLAFLGLVAAVYVSNYGVPRISRSGGDRGTMNVSLDNRDGMQSQAESLVRSHQ